METTLPHRGHGDSIRRSLKGAELLRQVKEAVAAAEVPLSAEHRQPAGAGANAAQGTVSIRMRDETGAVGQRVHMQMRNILNDRAGNAYVSAFGERTHFNRNYIMATDQSQARGICRLLHFDATQMRKSVIEYAQQMSERTTCQQQQTAGVSFGITGVIPAMGLRDSTAQVLHCVRSAGSGYGRGGDRPAGGGILHMLMTNHAGTGFTHGRFDPNAPEKFPGSRGWSRCSAKAVPFVRKKDNRRRSSAWPGQKDRIKPD